MKQRAELGITPSCAKETADILDIEQADRVDTDGREDLEAMEAEANVMTGGVGPASWSLGWEG